MFRSESFIAEKVTKEPQSPSMTKAGIIPFFTKAIKIANNVRRFIILIDKYLEV